ncbi:hypothetical protein ACFQ78_34225 [Streptomyces sp. NPDC056519]|uniref:hypothetical protein n=1 Tax=Streptomyces sp. NPDC056519 TaxID=3345849 RepID=UPI0036C109E8
MPVQTWVPVNTDLDFILDKRPRDVHDLLKKGRRWIDLYGQWLPYGRPAGGADHTIWFELVQRYERTHSLQKSLRETPEAGPRMADWDLLVGLTFFEACGKVRAWLEEERKQARKDLEAEHGPFAWYQWGVSDKDVKARQQRNIQNAITQAHAERLRKAAREAREAEEDAAARQRKAATTAARRAAAAARLRQDSTTPAEEPRRDTTTPVPKRKPDAPAVARRRLKDRDGHRPHDTDGTLAYVEVSLVAYTLKVKPRVNELFGIYAQLDKAGPSAARQSLERAHAPLLSAEAELRKTCGQLRNAPAASKPDAEKAVIAAWTRYTKACSDMGAAVREAAEGFIRWVIEDTSKKIQASFESAHPGVAWALWVVELLVTILSGLLQAIGYMAAPAGPQVTAVTMTAGAALLSALELIKAATVRLVSDVSASDPVTYRRHLGATYESPDGLVRKVAETAEVVSRVANLGSAPAAAGMRYEAQQSGDPTGPLAQAAPFVALLSKITGLIERAVKLANPQVLTDTADRPALVAMLDRAEADLRSRPYPGGAVAVIDYPKTGGDGGTRVSIEGRSGTMRNGRFHPDDRREILPVALSRWAKTWSKVQANPRFEAITYSYPALDPSVPKYFTPVRGFVIHKDWSPAEWDDVAQGTVVCASDEVAGGFRCRSVASALGLGSADGNDRWEVEFFVSHEGEARLLGAEFQWLTLYAKNHPATLVVARTPEQAKALLGLRAEDPELDVLLLVQSALGLPAQHFELTAEGLLDNAGTRLLDHEVLEVLCTRREDARRLLEELERGQPAGVTACSLPDKALTFLLTGWEIPINYYAWVLEQPGKVEQWVCSETLSARWTENDPLSLVRFLRFVRANPELSEDLEMIGRLFDEGQTALASGDTEQRAYLEQLEQLIKAGEAPRQPLTARGW